MHVVANALPVDELDGGTILLSGPAMAGKYDLLIDLVVDGLRLEDGALFVTTNETAADVIADIEAQLGHPAEHLRVVDSLTEQQGNADPPANPQVAYVNSPADLTGIGIGVSEQLGRLVDETGTGQTRIVFDSVSTLLMYAELQTVFRFMHVLAGRIEAIDALGVFSLDPSAHEDGSINTLKQLFDAMIEVRRSNDGRELRFVGVPNAPREWISQS